MPLPRAALLNPSYDQFFGVIPAQAGIHLDLREKAKWIPAYAGMTVPG